MWLTRPETKMKLPAKTAAEIIAFHLGCNWDDVRDGLYQRHRSPGVYVCSEAYYCCPTAKQKLPGGFKWTLVGAEYGRNIYRSEGTEA